MGDYKQPRAINSVSVTLFLLLGAVVWVAISAFPAIKVNNAVRGELADALPVLYRVNLRLEPAATQSVNELKQSLLEKFKKLNVNESNLEIIVTRDTKKVRIEVKHEQVITLEGTHKSRTVHFHPAVETTADRVEW